MVVLGLLLLAGAAVLTTAVVTSNTGSINTDLWGWHMSNLSVGAVFVIGVITGAVALLALGMMVVGARRNARRSRERRALVKENRRLAERTDSMDDSAVATTESRPVKEEPTVVSDERPHHRTGVFGRRSRHEEPVESRRAEEPAYDSGYTPYDDGRDSTTVVTPSGETVDGQPTTHHRA